jgi:DNA repair protein RadD
LVRQGAAPEFGPPGTATTSTGNTSSIPSLSDSCRTFLDVVPEVCDRLYDYQRRQIAETAEAIHAGHRKILLQDPTGAGKTHILAGIVAAACHANLRSLILATRTRLVRQIHERLDEFHIHHGIIAAELKGIDRFASVQIASADTLYRRCLISNTMPLPSADIVIFDECHLAAAESRLKLIEQYPNTLLIGFTATPARKSGRPLSDVFDKLILGPTVVDLIESKRLVRPRIFSVPILTKKELEELPKDTGGDYQSGATAKKMSAPKLIGDVLQNWLRIANGKKTLIFAVNKAHGQALSEEFCQAGVATELLTDDDDEDTREAVIERLKSGVTTVVVNCFLLSYGTDIPPIECIMLARPTRSVVMYLQSVGRGLRTHPGKEYCIVIDHGRVVESLGRPTDEFGWSLEDGRNVNQDASDIQARKHVDERPRTCGECAYVWAVSEEGSSCPLCGWRPAMKVKPIAVKAADLAELDAKGGNTPSWLSSEVQHFYRQSLGDVIERDPAKWAETPTKVRASMWHALREKFELPTDNIPSIYWRLEPEKPTQEVRGWLKYRRIRFARSRVQS